MASAADNTRTFTFEVRVTHEDVDKMGVARYDCYFRWFGQGRQQYVANLPEAVREMAAEEHQLPVLESYIRYLEPALHADLLQVRTRLQQVDRDHARFHYQIVRDEDDVTVAQGHTVHTCAGPSGYRRRFPASLQVALRQCTISLAAPDP